MIEKYRKHIRLKDFNYSSDGAYFITICTSHKQPLLFGSTGRLVTEELLDLERRFPAVSVEYKMIMKDHIHFILFLHDAKVSIPRIIQVFKSLTTLKLKKTGYLEKRFWQPNYYEHIIRNEKAIYRIIEYIENNPVVEKLNMKEIYGSSND